MVSSPSNNSPPHSNPNTTFVHAPPSTFRAVVQRLTGKSNTADVVSPRRRPAFKLHERRSTARNLQIKLNSNNNGGAPSLNSPARNQRSTSTTAALIGNVNYYCNIVASPVSPLEYVAARGSPRTPPKSRMEEERFYLQYTNPLSRNPKGSDPPELLPLFPLHSDELVNNLTSYM